MGGYEPPSGAEPEMCQRCKHRAVIAEGLCYPCRVARDGEIATEVDAGVNELQGYLRKRDAFEEWCAQRTAQDSTEQGNHPHSDNDPIGGEESHGLSA